MANFGIEGIRYFGNARANKVATVSDFTYTFNICNGLDDKLRSAGHTRGFYWANQDCWETDIRDSDQGGDDVTYADNVDLFFIMSHGGNTSGEARLLYDVAKQNWRTYSGTWQLGENWNSEWVMAYSCDTVDLGNVGGLWNIFAGMHIYCGAWGLMWDGPTTAECGADIGANLINGHTVASSWIDGVTDWSLDNHPITVCVGDAATWNNGNVNWDASYLNRDHLWGHGTVDPDLPPNRQACLLWCWTEG